MTQRTASEISGCFFFFFVSLWKKKKDAWHKEIQIQQKSTRRQPVLLTTRGPV